MLLRELNAVYSENHTNPIYTLCGKYAGMLDVEAGGVNKYHIVKVRLASCRVTGTVL
jgi:hypothetical protein